MLLKETFAAFAHLFFPHTCIGCGSDTLGYEQVLCLRCNEELPYTNFHLHSNNPVEKKFWGRLPVVNATALFYFSKGSVIQHLLHQLKYKNNKAAGNFLGEQLGDRLRNAVRFNDIDALVPLPLFAAREKQRGYNQSLLLCKAMSRVMHIPVIANAVVRTNATQTQTNKTRIERWENMENKFSVVEPALLQHKHILLVDDVITTGATLEACGRAIREVDGVRLSIAAVAFAMM